MIRRTIAALALAALSAACGTDAASPSPSSPFGGVSTENPRDLPVNFGSREGRQGPSGGIVFDPISEPIDHGAAYLFDLGHCGLLSPVDVDGSFWDALDGTSSTGAELDLSTDGEMINATSGVIVVIGDEARFRTASGSVVRFTRHEGEKEFPACM